MLEPERLNPDEVLFHLNALGFHHVTQQQLKEFLHDLKKLIKHDQKHSSGRCRECGFVRLNSPGGDFECNCPGSKDDGSVSSSDGDSYSGSSIVSHLDSTNYKMQEAEEQLNESSEQAESREGNEKDNLPKVPSSFIRPWNLSLQRIDSSKRKRNLDPVSLYHRYKLLWSRQKIPGESNHSQLRWIIRNKMLGQEP